MSSCIQQKFLLPQKSCILPPSLWKSLHLIKQLFCKIGYYPVRHMHRSSCTQANTWQRYAFPENVLSHKNAECWDAQSALSSGELYPLLTSPCQTDSLNKTSSPTSGTPAWSANILVWELWIIFFSVFFCHAGASAGWLPFRPCLLGSYDVCNIMHLFYN